jgi:hypothetical protein
VVRGGGWAVCSAFGGRFMARRTQARQIEDGNDQQELVHLETTLGGLVDPRRPQGVCYPLPSVIVIALMAMV